MSMAGSAYRPFTVARLSAIYSSGLILRVERTCRASSSGPGVGSVSRILFCPMSKTFRAWKIDEPLFMPPTVQDFVAEDHLARFALSLVIEDLDLSEITGTYGSEKGQPPFDPVMMVALLLYAYCCGI